MAASALQPSPALSLFVVPEMPLVRPGDDLAGLIVSALERAHLAVADADILVVAQKIVSKAENRLVDLAMVIPSDRARSLAERVGKDPRLVEVILSELRSVLRVRPGLLIVEHRNGFIMANAGVDQSNVAEAGGSERVLLLPLHPDASAAALRQRLETHFSRRLAVIVNDSVGRAWRRGTVGIALGASGLPALLDMRGMPDLFGRKLRVSETGFADQIAGAASLLMGEAAEGHPAVLLRGLRWSAPPTPAVSLIRSAGEDLFR